MGLFDWFFSRKQRAEPKNSTGTSIELITQTLNGYYSWNGKLYQSDVVRACIRPKAKAIGKLVAKHIREDAQGIQVNPEAYMRFLLEEPNQYMTGQMFQEKLAVQLELNNNAFALILRDEYDYPRQLYPIPCRVVEAEHDKLGFLYLKFTLVNGRTLKVPYSDVIHLRQDYNENDVFGDPPAKAIEQLMEIITASDQSIVNAVKNSAVLRWIMKFKAILQPADREMQVKEFVKNFLSIENTGGAAAADPRYDLEPVKDNTYVPNVAQAKETMQRVYNFFGTNEAIVQSKYNEDQWNAYYESSIEPVATQMSSEFTRKLFSRKERGFGNRIVFESSNLQYASMATKLNLMQMVDRGAMTPNEWRHVFNMAPIPGGDKAIRRLDTAVVAQLSEMLTEFKSLLKGGEKSADERAAGQPSEPAAS